MTNEQRKEVGNVKLNALSITIVARTRLRRRKAK